MVRDYLDDLSSYGVRIFKPSWSRWL